MRQPYMNMSRPQERDYLERTKQIAIYKYYEHYRHENYHEDDAEDEDEEENHRSDFPTNNGPVDGENHWYSGYRDQPPTPKKKLKEINLQFLIDLLPEGITPADVKIGFTIDGGDMGIYGHEVTFYYEKKLAPEPEKYAEDLAKWQKLWAEYEVKEAAYQESVKQQQVRELEEKLARLKK